MAVRALWLVCAVCFFECDPDGGPAPIVGVTRPSSAPYDRGVDRYGRGELDGAIEEYSEAIRLDPDSASAYCARALAWQDKGELDRAVADCEAALRLDPGHIWAYLNRAAARAAKGEFARALADYDEAVRLDPTCAVAYKNRASILASCPVGDLRDGKRAVDSAARACELTDWKDPACLDTLAAAYAEAGDHDTAAATLARAVEMTKGFEARLKAYRDKIKPVDAEGLAGRLSRSRPAAFASRRVSRPFFIVPYDAVLYLSAVGGSAGGVTEFGMGTSEDEHAPVFTGLPAEPWPNREVKIGFVAAGSALHFYEKTDWDGMRWAFSRDPKSEAARVAFRDRDGSLGLEGEVVEKTGPETWLLHLDDAASVDIDDNDGDVLIEMRLAPAKPPVKP